MSNETKMSTIDKNAVRSYNMFKQPRIVGEANVVLNLKQLVPQLAGRNTGERNAFLSFLENEVIESVSLLDSNSVVQRVFISKYLENKLLIFLAKSEDNELCINRIITHIINEGTLEQWYEYVVNVVLPYMFKQKRMFN